MLRFVNSGTEATMSASVARAATGRTKFMKFEGCYHGHADAFLLKAGSGLINFCIPFSSGVPSKELSKIPFLFLITIYKPLNGIFSNTEPKLRLVIVEPIAANMGRDSQSKHNFLNFLR